MSAKILCTLAFALCVAGAASAQDEVDVIVGFNGDPDSATFEKHGGKVKSSNAAIGFVAGKIHPGALARLRKEGNVAYVEEDHVATTSSHPRNWGRVRVQAAVPSTGWTAPLSGRIRVAVCDTGINLAHADLAGQAVAGIKYAAPETGDVNGHGSHVTGTIVALPTGDPVMGVAVDALAVEVKVLDDTGSGSYSAIANGILWAADPLQGDCRVINLSLGGRFGSTTLSNAINTAWNKGAVICAAAGNSGTKTVQYPAAYTNCIAVAATDSTLPSDPLAGTDVRASFSNFGTWVDLSAPGVQIWSTTGDGYESWNGTSMATPHVSGAAALVFAKYPGATASEVRQRLEATRGPVVDRKKLTPGVVDCKAATAPATLP